MSQSSRHGLLRGRLIFSPPPLRSTHFSPPSAASTKIQALSLLHALSATDDSQRAALRTPRVLHAALTCCTSVAAQGSQRGHQVPPASAAAGTTAAEGDGPSPVFGAVTTRIQGERASNASGTGAPSAIVATTATGAPLSAMSVTANAVARMLLTELLPQGAGDGSSSGNSNIAAAFAAASAGGAGASGMAGGAGGVARVAGWLGGAGGHRWARPAAAGAWCSGLDFDRGMP